MGWLWLEENMMLFWRSLWSYSTKVWSMVGLRGRSASHPLDIIVRLLFISLSPKRILRIYC